MSPVPPPAVSPEPPRIGDHESPSGSHKIPNIRETMVIADQAVEKTARSTRLQWIGLGTLGAVTMGVGGFLAWCLITLGVIGNAQAQTGAKADTALESSKQNATRIEAVDAGNAAKFDRLERKIDANEEHAQRERDAQNAKLDRILAEVKKR